MPVTTPEAPGPYPSQPDSSLLNFLPTPVTPDFDEWLPEVPPMSERELFLAELNDHLPDPYFFESTQGVILIERERGDAVAICGPLRVTARIRATGREPARLLLAVDDEGEMTTITIPANDLGSARPTGVLMLRSMGFYAPGTDRAVATLLRQFRPPVIDLPIATPGWVSTEPAVFCLPDDTIVGQASSKAFFPAGLPVASRNPVALEEWQKDMGPLLSGNPLPIFAVCVALTGPLLRPLGLGSFGFNIVAKTSRGKSTATNMAAEVWPNGRLFDWGGTRAALDDLCLAAQGTFLALDEMPTDKPKITQDEVYYLFNNRRRNARPAPGTASKDGAAQWAVPVLTSSEETLAHTAREAGVKLRQGAFARLVELDARLQVGEIWSQIQPFNNAAQKTEAVRSASAKHTGTLGPAFMWCLVRHWEQLVGLLPTLLDQSKAAIIQDLRIDEKETRDESLRVVGHFAAVLSAGRIAAKFRVLPFPLAEVVESVLTAARLWQATKSGPRAISVEGAVERMRIWLRDEAAALLVEVDGRRRPVQKKTASHGWWNTEHYFLRTFALEELAKGTPSMKAFRAHLLETGILLRSGTIDSCQFKMSSKIVGQPLVYKIDRRVLEDGFDEEDD